MVVLADSVYTLYYMGREFRGWMKLSSEQLDFERNQQLQASNSTDGSRFIIFNCNLSFSL